MTIHGIARNTFEAVILPREKFKIFAWANIEKSDRSKQRGKEDLVGSSTDGEEDGERLAKKVTF